MNGHADRTGHKQKRLKTSSTSQHIASGAESRVVNHQNGKILERGRHQTRLIATTDSRINAIDKDTYKVFERSPSSPQCFIPTQIAVQDGHRCKCCSSSSSSAHERRAAEAELTKWTGYRADLLDGQHGPQPSAVQHSCTESRRCWCKGKHNSPKTDTDHCQLLP